MIGRRRGMFSGNWPTLVEKSKQWQLTLTSNYQGDGKGSLLSTNSNPTYYFNSTTTVHLYFSKKKNEKKGTLAGTLDPRHGILDPRQKDRLNICLQKRHNKLTLTSVIKLDLLTSQQRVLDPSLPRTSNCWRSRDKSFVSRLRFTTCVFNVGRQVSRRSFT